MKIRCPLCGCAKIRVKTANYAELSWQEPHGYHLGPPLDAPYFDALQSTASCFHCSWAGNFQECIDQADDVIHSIQQGLKNLDIWFEVSAVRALFLGGSHPQMHRLMEYLVQRGYNDDASTYKENYFFWKALGIKESEFKQLTEGQG